MPLDPNGPLDPSGYVDSFARDHLPPRELWPVMDHGGVPGLDYPRRLNAAVELLDRMVENGHSSRPCLRTDAAASCQRKAFLYARMNSCLRMFGPRSRLRNAAS